jgi:amino acid transporter
MGEPHGDGLQRHFGLTQATALNITMVIGAGIFATIPLMLRHLPGPYALLGWICAGVLVLLDSLIWSELGAAMPSSGGSYVYLRECYGRRWGRLMAFLFIWQFLISGPLEIASGLIAIDGFSSALSPRWSEFNESHTWAWKLCAEPELTFTVSPARLTCVGLGLLILFLLYRNVKALGRWTMTFWVGVLAACAWVLIEGWIRFDPARAFDWNIPTDRNPKHPAMALGAAMALAMYSYLGYYNICYIGDEVRDPGRTIPRAILISAVFVGLLFVGLHLAMLGTISWHEVPIDDKELKNYSLAAVFMQRIHGSWAAQLLTVLLIWGCLGAAFAGLLGYSRIPYGAARQGHFFRFIGRIHPGHRIPHVSLFLVGGLTLFWTFFSLEVVINALITTRILVQFVGQIVGVALLRRLRPELKRPFRIWLYPVPCGLALVGWLYLFIASEPLYIWIGTGTVVAGLLAYLIWSGGMEP